MFCACEASVVKSPLFEANSAVSGMESSKATTTREALGIKTIEHAQKSQGSQFRHKRREHEIQVDLTLHHWAQLTIIRGEIVVDGIKIITQLR